MLLTDVVRNKICNISEQQTRANRAGYRRSIPLTLFFCRGCNKIKLEVPTTTSIQASSCSPITNQTNNHCISWTVGYYCVRWQESIIVLVMLYNLLQNLYIWFTSCMDTFLNLLCSLEVSICDLSQGPRDRPGTPCQSRPIEIIYEEWTTALTALHYQEIQ